VRAGNCAFLPGPNWTATGWFHASHSWLQARKVAALIRRWWANPLPVERADYACGQPATAFGPFWVAGGFGAGCPGGHATFLALVISSSCRPAFSPAPSGPTPFEPPPLWLEMWALCRLHALGVDGRHTRRPLRPWKQRLPGAEQHEGGLVGGPGGLRAAGRCSPAQPAGGSHRAAVASGWATFGWTTSTPRSAVRSWPGGALAGSVPPGGSDPLPFSLAMDWRLRETAGGLTAREPR